MKLPDGREVLCTLALPLPLALVGELGQGIADAAERAGYIEVDMLTDGTNRIVATRRGHADGSAAETTSREAWPESVWPAPVGTATVALGDIPEDTD